MKDEGVIGFTGATSHCSPSRMMELAEKLAPDTVFMTTTVKGLVRKL